MRVRSLSATPFVANRLIARKADFQVVHISKLASCKIGLI